jgi:hypothetical protein
VKTVSTSDGLQEAEYNIEYDADGRLASCFQDIDGIRQGQFVHPRFLTNFPRASEIFTPVWALGNCTDIVEYDDLGRPIRIETPAIDGFSGFIETFDYLADKIVSVLVAGNPDIEFEEIREFDISSTGELTEDRIIRDGEVVFRHVREYMSLELPGVP